MSEREGIIYLTPDKNKWVTYYKGRKIRTIFQTTTGRAVKRTINFSTIENGETLICINWKRKRIKVPYGTLLEE